MFKEISIAVFWAISFGFAAALFVLSFVRGNFVAASIFLGVAYVLSGDLLISSVALYRFLKAGRSDNQNAK